MAKILGKFFSFEKTQAFERIWRANPFKMERAKQTAAATGTVFGTSMATGKVQLSVEDATTLFAIQIFRDY